MERKRPADPAAGDRARTPGAAAAAIAAIGLLLFLWPFVRTPPLDLSGSYVHLVLAWIVIVAALGWLSTMLGRGRRGGDRDA